MGPRSPEAKLARKIEDALNVFDFNEGFVAYILSKSTVKVQERMFNMFMHMVYLWALSLEDGTFDKHGFNTVVNAKRIQESMESYGYVFNTQIVE